MHAVRRAVLRSTASASLSVSRAASSPATTPLVRSLARHAVRQPAQPLAVAARFFSQTARVANAEEKSTLETVEPSVVAAEQDAAADSSPDAPAAASKEEAATPTNPAGTSGVDETPYGVFIRNIVFDATEAHLTEAFAHYGPVHRAAIARDARGLSRGYGFVWFEAADAQQKAVAEADGMFWHGRRLAVRERVPKQRPGGGAGGAEGGAASSASKTAPTTSLYIGNLPYETTDADLNQIFGSIEGVVAVRVAVDRSTGWPRGFAHADFRTTEQASAAYDALAGRSVGSRQLRVDFATPSNASNKRGSNSNKNQQGSRQGTPAEETLQQ